MRGGELGIQCDRPAEFGYRLRVAAQSHQRVSQVVMDVHPIGIVLENATVEVDGVRGAPGLLQRERAFVLRIRPFARCPGEIVRGKFGTRLMT